MKGSGSSAQIKMAKSWIYVLETWSDKYLSDTNEWMLKLSRADVHETLACLFFEFIFQMFTFRTKK